MKKIIEAQPAPTTFLKKKWRAPERNTLSEHKHNSGVWHKPEDQQVDGNGVTKSTSSILGCCSSLLILGVLFLWRRSLWEDSGQFQIPCSDSGGYGETDDCYNGAHGAGYGYRNIPLGVSITMIVSCFLCWCLKIFQSCDNEHYNGIFWRCPKYIPEYILAHDDDRNGVKTLFFADTSIIVHSRGDADSGTLPSVCHLSSSVTRGRTLLYVIYTDVRNYDDSP